MRRRARRPQLKRDPLDGYEHSMRQLLLVALAATALGIGPTLGAAQVPRAPAHLPGGWIAVPPPAPESEQAICANWADTTWLASLGPDSAELHITPDSREPMADSVSAAGGWLVGYNHGEFGGDILWRPQHGGEITIAKDNLVAFVPVAGGLLGLAGLAHLGINEGRLLAFHRGPDDTWKITTLMALGAEPRAYSLLARDTLLVVAMGSVLLLKAPDYEKVLHQSRLLELAYPHSIVRDRSGVIYVGMRFAVTRLQPIGNEYRADWIVPAACPSSEKVDQLYQCRCTPSAKH
jgi:hypothetical protein